MPLSRMRLGRCVFTLVVAGLLCAAGWPGSRLAAQRGGMFQGSADDPAISYSTAPVDNVVDQHKVVDTLFKVTRILRVGVLVAALVMLVSAAVLIANTVRMGLFARRKEIGIMKLVGATNWRIRLPFLVEGLFESLIGATVAILFLFAMKVAFIDPLYGSTALRFIPWITNSDVVAIIPWLVVAGALVALVAGLVGMRRFLDV